MHTTNLGGMVSFPVAGGYVKSVATVMSAGYRFAVINGGVKPAVQASTWNSWSGSRGH